MDYRLETAKLTEEQFDERDSIMDAFVPERYKAYGWSGGVKPYQGLDLKTLKMLVEKGYASSNERQNAAPSIKGFMEIMERNPDLKAHGYFVERTRDDARISVEGVEGKCAPEDARKFKRADDYTYSSKTGELYCWYD